MEYRLVLLRCLLNQVVVDCREVLFLPREHVVDARGRYVEMDLDPCRLIVIDLIVSPSSHGRGGYQSRYVVNDDVLTQMFRCDAVKSFSRI